MRLASVIFTIFSLYDWTYSVQFTNATLAAETPVPQQFPSRSGCWSSLVDSDWFSSNLVLFEHTILPVGAPSHAGVTPLGWFLVVSIPLASPTASTRSRTQQQQPPPPMAATKNSPPASGKRRKREFSRRSWWSTSRSPGRWHLRQPPEASSRCVLSFVAIFLLLVVVWLPLLALVMW